ncbi:hypothetical protein OIU77_002411 [Salix suchowensis]|uniref:Maturase K n=1 Tax=Salix suchowensis TaxID=1278906 RepID=A0ABQ9B4K4_9ROSI|nr:hypothetical protein OIU77_002411 [Salix suchowensis]
MLYMNHSHILLNYMYRRFNLEESRDIQEQTFFIRNTPLMNSLGTSIVNRIYKFVINQILQTPDIYYWS